MMLVRIANYQIYARERREFFGGSLCIAARDYDASFGVLAADSADRCTRILISSSRHRAGVQDHNRCLIRASGAGKSLLFELALQRGAIGLRGATTEVFYVIGRHFSIVAQL